jgi:hypothetical protein
LAELERRKFTAEEGVSGVVPAPYRPISPCLRTISRSSTVFAPISPLASTDRLAAYNAFMRAGRSSSWCKSHALSFRALSRAVSIRAQLKKYMQRFGLPLASCEGDAKRLRRCLVAGYWRNSARWAPDGSYRAVRGGGELAVHPNSVLFTRKPRSGWVVFHEMEETKKTQ